MTKTHVTLEVQLTAKECAAMAARITDWVGWRTWVPEEDQLIRARQRAISKYENLARSAAVVLLQEPAK